MRWDVRLPFTTQTEADGDHARAVIDTLDPEAGRAGWIARGVAIHAVNGQPLARGTSLEEAILASLTVDPDGRTRVPVLYRAPGGDMLELGTIEAPVVHRTALADGTVLTTGAENGAPVTRITATGRAPSDLQPGDIVVEEAQTGTWLASPQDIASALETLAGRNAKEAAFTILRDGRRRTASWPLVQP